MSSKKVWLDNGSNIIELRPITKNLVVADTQRELVDYLLEFTINKSFNEKTYTL